MIGKIAQRLGFRRSVPVSVVDGWTMPAPTGELVELAPRQGRASCLVDETGRIVVTGGQWTLDFTFAAGARWVPAVASERVAQVLVPPAVIETTIRTPAGPVVQRVATGVVDGKPVAVVEIENTGDVAIAMGVVLRPVVFGGRGYVREIAVDRSAMSVDGVGSVRFLSHPAAVAAQQGSDGDILDALPAADDGAAQASALCRSGGAQAAAVWPIPHTATVRLVVELDEPTSPAGAVPSVEDINRGWQAHLGRGLRVEVDGLGTAVDLTVAARSLLTLWPDGQDPAHAIVAVSELGFGRDAGRFFPSLERSEDDDQVLRALSRWAQLGDQAHQLEDLELILGRVARAAHVVVGRGGELVGQPWLPSALVALGGRLHQIDQPDVAARVQGLTTAVGGQSSPEEVVAELAMARTDRGVWPGGHVRCSVQLVRALRALVIDDAGSELALLGRLPVMWRGRAIDVFDLPVANGTISFGLRWHGPRPALLWEASLVPGAPMRVTVPGLDAGFESNEYRGETLLEDPGWKRR